MVSESSTCYQKEVRDKMIIYIINFIIGIFAGIGISRTYYYFRDKSKRDFEKRQERYRRMI